MKKFCYDLALVASFGVLVGCTNKCADQPATSDVPAHQDLKGEVAKTK